MGSAEDTLKNPLGLAQPAPTWPAKDSRAREREPVVLPLGDAKEGVLPLGLAQKEVWADQMAWPGSAHLNIGGGAYIEGPLDEVVFKRALQHLVEEADVLRMAPLPDGTQRLLATLAPQFERVDLSQAANPRQAMRDWWRARIREPFDLSAGPPWRFALLHGSDTLHGLTIQFHHVLMDGWGTTQVMRRWSLLYNALLGGLELPPMQGEQFQRAIADAHGYRESPGYTRDGEYWLRQIGQAPEPLIEKKPGHRAVAQTLPASHLVEQELDRAAYARMSEQAVAMGFSAFTCFLAGLALYLSRSTGQQVLVIGVPTLNRSGLRYKHTPGMFVGVLPLRLKIDSAQTAGDLLAHVARQLAEGLRHARYPLGELGRGLQLLRLGRDSLLDVMISFERQDYDLNFGAAQLVDSRQLFAGQARYPLAITVCEFDAAARPELAVEASSACFSAEEAALFGRRLWATARALIDQPSRLLAEVSVMPAAEQHALLHGLHQNLSHLASPPSFIEQFEQHVAFSPDACALVWDDGPQTQTMSYHALDVQANALATQLTALGAGPERIVALALPRSPTMVIAMLATAKAGAAFLPLNPETPTARQAEILADSEAIALLVAPDADDALRSLHAQLIVVDGQAAVAPPLASRPATLNQLAYVLYTSGSTGVPKGVLMPHGSLSRRLAWLAKTWGIDSNDRAAQTTQPTFDPALVELLLPLTQGASIAIPPPGRLHPDRLADFIRRHGATFCALVPATVAGILNGLRDKPKDALPLKLRVACCGGEVLSPELARRFVNETGARLYNVYGPTEATIFCTAWPCVGGSAPSIGTEAPPLPLGRVLDDTRIYVLDEALRPQPFFVPGEIYIGGSTLARGYLNRPELTQERFITDPFVADAMMYRSGDRGWLDPQGLLHFGGRADRQIKLRGYRIEPGDIEAACIAVAGVSQAHVAKHEPADGGAPRLHAWVAAPADLSVDVLRHLLRERLPDYMVPGSFSLLPALPVTATGKIDLQALPEPADAVAPRAAHRQAATALEQQLLGLWQKALKRDDIGVKDDFFDLGGDSLAALEVFSAMEDALGRPLSLHLISDHPTIEQLAGALGAPLALPGIVHALGRATGATPLFLAASGRGDVLRFQTLANTLGAAFDVYMLQPPIENAPTTPQALGEIYADAIAALGLAPGWLSGFSVAGVAALETVRALQLREEPPLGLLLLDTIHPDAALGGGRSWRTLGRLVRWLYIEELSMNGRRLGAVFSDPGLLVQVLALSGYRCKGVSGPVLLIKSVGLGKWNWLFFRRWRSPLPQIEMTEVPGLHGSIFEPARVGAMAQAIQRFTEAHTAVA